MNLTGWVVDEFGEIVKSTNSPDMAGLLLDVSETQALVLVGPPTWAARWVDGAWVPRPPSPGLYAEWDKSAAAWVDPRTLAQAKVDRWAAIKSERNDRVVTAKPTSVGLFDADEASQNNLNKVIALVQIAAGLGAPAQANYTLATNERVNLTLTQLSMAALEMGAQVQVLYDTADGLRTQIEAATTTQELEAITWPVT